MVAASIRVRGECFQGSLRRLGRMTTLRVYPVVELRPQATVNSTVRAMNRPKPLIWTSA